MDDEIKSAMLDLAQGLELFACEDKFDEERAMALVSDMTFVKGKLYSQIEKLEPGTFTVGANSLYRELVK